MKQGYYFTGNETFKVNPNIINEIKQDYINGKETKSLLFKKYYRKYNIDRFTFINIIEDINQELGINKRVSINKKAIKLMDSKMGMNQKPNYYNPSNFNKKY